MFTATTIEDIFLYALEPLKTNGIVKTLESYGGQFNVEDASKIVVRFPAVYVTWTRSENVLNRFADAVTSNVVLLVAASNLRGESSARRGAKEGFGAYAILDECRKLLHRMILDEAWTPAIWLNDDPVGYSPERGIVVYASTYEIKRAFSSRAAQKVPTRDEEEG